MSRLLLGTALVGGAFTNSSAVAQGPRDNTLRGYVVRGERYPASDEDVRFVYRLLNGGHTRA